MQRRGKGIATPSPGQKANLAPVRRGRKSGTARSRSPCKSACRFRDERFNPPGFRLHFLTRVPEGAGIPEMWGDLWDSDSLPRARRANFTATGEAQGHRRRPRSPPREERVHAPARPRVGPDPGLHQGGIAAGRLGATRSGREHPDPRQPRQPPAAQARPGQTAGPKLDLSPTAPGSSNAAEVCGHRVPHARWHARRGEGRGGRDRPADAMALTVR